MIRRRCQSAAALRVAGAVLSDCDRRRHLAVKLRRAGAGVLETSLGCLSPSWMTYTVLAARLFDRDAAMRVYDALKADDPAESREKFIVDRRA